MTAAEEFSAAYEQALRWLARREYGQVELQRRLRAKEHTDSAIDATLERLRANGLQSDQRFVEAYIRGRSQRGYGPLRIRAELSERGLDRELISEMLDPDDQQWTEQAGGALQKRFPEPPVDARERARRERFLRYRGFVHGQIAKAMSQYPCQHQ